MVDNLAPDGINDDDVRLTAYFLWEQEGRPHSDPSDFWHKALEIHRRAHANNLELEEGLAAQQRERANAEVQPDVSDPHPAEEGDPYGSTRDGGVGPPAG